jgi:hypothetical protein
MYEKPQYLTKDGYKRLGKNPNKDGAHPLVLKKTKAQTVREIQMRIPYKGKGISEQAAKLIAMALKDMLKDKK